MWGLSMRLADLVDGEVAAGGLCKEWTDAAARELTVVCGVNSQEVG